MSETNAKYETEREKAALPVELDWHRGPALGGGGTAGKNEHGISQWEDGDTLMIVVDNEHGRSLDVVTIHAADEIFEVDATDSHGDPCGWDVNEWAWWAVLSPSTLPNDAVETEREGNLGGFSYADVTTEGCEGWLNLFWGDYPVGLVNDVRIADQIRKAILEQADRAECINNLVGKLYRERGTLATELAKAEYEAEMYSSELSEAQDEMGRMKDQLAEAEAERDKLRDSIATIAWEAFGPFPIQSAEENLAAIEQGVARHRQKLCEAESELSLSEELVGRLGKILNDTINVLRGPPPEMQSWSTHDAAEVAAKVVEERDTYRTALDATSKLANDSLTELEQLRPKLVELERLEGITNKRKGNDDE